jgi:hypothetical protein
MALKSLKSSVAAVAPAKKSDSKLVPFKGTAITEYIALKKEVEERQARMEALELEIKEKGTDAIIELNCANASNPLSSVKLVDENLPASQGIVAFTSRYSDVDADAFSAVFAEINARRAAAGQAQVDEQDFAQFVAVAKVNLDAFCDKDGNFQEPVYEAIRKAVADATAKLVASGKVVAGTQFITEAQKAKVKPNFHANRWSLGVEDNKALLGVVKNAISLKAVLA